MITCDWRGVPRGFDSPRNVSKAAGVWDELVFDEIMGQTSFFDYGASFLTTVSAGDLLCPDVTKPGFWLAVAAVASNDELIVEGFQLDSTAPGASCDVQAPNHWSSNGGVFDPDTGVQFQEGEKKPGRVRADWSPPQNQEVL